jgi:hypothetical protein
MTDFDAAGGLYGGLGQKFSHGGGNLLNDIFSKACRWAFRGVYAKTGCWNVVF